MRTSLTMVKITLNEKAQIDVNSFRGKTWIHVRHLVKNKTVSLDKADIKALFNRRTELKKAIEKVDKRNAEKKNYGCASPLSTADFETDDVESD